MFSEGNKERDVTMCNQAWLALDTDQHMHSWRGEF